MSTSSSFLRAHDAHHAPVSPTSNEGSDATTWPRQSILQRSIARVGRGGRAVVASLADAGLSLAVQCILCKDLMRRCLERWAGHRLERLAATPATGGGLRLELTRDDPVARPPEPAHGPAPRSGFSRSLRR